MLILAIGSAVIGSQWLVATPAPSPTVDAAPSPEATPQSHPPQPSPTNPAEQIGAGTLARVREAAAILDEPGGTQWAIIEPEQHVLVVDVLQTGAEAWFRVEFEFCCRADYAGFEWVFGWVAADLLTAGLRDPGFGIDPPEDLAGPTLEATEWACPESPEELYLIPEPVRHQCYGFGEVVTIRGIVGDGVDEEALYPGDPDHLTGLPNASLTPIGMESGYRVFPLHIPIRDPVLLAWLNDERVRRGDEVEVTGVFGPGAVACTKAPRVEDLPPMSPDEQQSWCDQQFHVTDIDGDGPDPIIEAPLADPLWTPPPGTQLTSGDGWRLLASATRNQLAVTVSSETVDFALDAQNYRRLWLSMARGEPPPIDLSTEFVVQFVPAVSGTCPWITLTGIGVKDDQRLLYGDFEGLPAELFIEVPENFGCTTDATPHAFLVAIERSLAPGNEFRLRLQEERLCEECGITWDETVVRLED